MPERNYLFGMRRTGENSRKSNNQHTYHQSSQQATQKEPDLLSTELTKAFPIAYGTHLHYRSDYYYSCSAKEQNVNSKKKEFQVLT